MTGATATATYQGAPYAALLVAGNTYTFTVQVGTSVGIAASAPSNPMLEGTPSAPTNVVATEPTNGTADVSFTVPPDNGSTITSYVVEAMQGTTVYGSNTVTTGLDTTAGDTETLAYSGTALRAGSYTFVVLAANAIGISQASAPSNAVSVLAPSAPTNVVAAPGPNGTATVSFTVPSGNGSPITTYLLFAYQGTTLYGIVAVTPSTTMTGATATATYQGAPYAALLVAGNTYTFTVQVGTSVGIAASAPSNPMLES
jgi:hypothetical protein